MKALVYLDRGVDRFSARHSITALEELGFDTRRIRGQELIDGDWSCDLLLFPGGRDIHYCEQLDGEGTRRIREYVEGGGFYFGICAGAYFGCSHIEFEPGHPIEVIGARELSFFPGCGHGPALGLGTFRYGAPEGADLAKIKWGEHEAMLYYNGGCAFYPDEGASGYEVVANYSEVEGEPAAIVDCQVGKGRALLSGVHIEYRAEQLDPHPHTQTLVPRLKEAEDGRLLLLRALLAL